MYAATRTTSWLFLRCVILVNDQINCRNRRLFLLVVGDKPVRQRARSCELSVTPVWQSEENGSDSPPRSKEAMSAFHGDNSSKLTNWLHNGEAAHVTVGEDIEGSYKIKPLEVSVDVEKKNKSNSTSDSASIDSDVIAEITRFNRKKQQGNIDVWWLFDDGGEKG